MPAQTILSSVLPRIFAKMAEIYNVSIGKYRRDLLAELFRVVLAMRGRVNFTNMARFSSLHEQTFRRHFAKALDWVAFRRTFALDATQTPPDLPRKRNGGESDYSRVGFYLEQVLDLLSRLSQVTFWVGDGY